VFGKDHHYNKKKGKYQKGGSGRGAPREFRENSGRWYPGGIFERGVGREVSEEGHREESLKRSGVGGRDQY
jgi:hypothetical protein